ncbi:MAG: D-serine ammonia-lyase [Oscillospiraceae bacterium]|nr:D-serine ammonia-lyase [Oscillospiraceae bacterium]
MFSQNENAIKNIKSEQCWINPFKLPFEMIKGVTELVVPDDDIEDAKERLSRFAPFIKKAFPETEETDGIIESPLREIPRMQKALEEEYQTELPGRLFLKMDSHLAVAGSVKARGGIYEVLKHAEDLALSYGKISLSDNYEKFASDEMREFLKQYTVEVGSTGNLGMSIGIMSAALGFTVKIHMSQDAKKWKKDLLRRHGVEVIEYASDYSLAVSEGRKNSASDPMSYFVDDEKSVDLFLGYAVAAGRLKKQLDEQNITVDDTHPLIVCIPAGVGGAPGGICYGLKRIFGDNVHCFFAEPSNCASVLLGIATQKFEKANVRDFGASGKTEADGLACASPSSFVTRIMTNLVSGIFTVNDGKLYDYMRHLITSENIRIEPSSCAMFEGVANLTAYENSAEYFKKQGISKDILKNSTVIAWATGGSLVPDEIFTEYLNTYL